MNKTLPIATILAIVVACAPMAQADKPVSSSYVEMTVKNYCYPLGSREALSRHTNELLRRELSALRDENPSGWQTLESQLREKADAVIEERRDAC